VHGDLPDVIGGLEPLRHREELVPGLGNAISGAVKHIRVVVGDLHIRPAGKKHQPAVKCQRLDE
jgi:hypothetical protein